MNGPDAAPGTMGWAWISAAIISVGVHLSVAALAWGYLSAAVSEGDLGADAIEVALVMEAPSTPHDDLPTGPDTAASKPAPEVADKNADDRDKDSPKAVEDDSNDLAAVSSDQQAESKNRDAAVTTEASQAQSASEATSRKSLDERAIESQDVKAPNLGIGKDQEKVTANWGRKISAYLDLHKQFPPGKSKTAKVGVNFVVNRSGKVVSIDVERSSGDSGYDAAAISMIRRADPVPSAPANLAGAEFAFSLDVNFNAAERRSGS